MSFLSFLIGRFTRSSQTLAPAGRFAVHASPLSLDEQMARLTDQISVFRERSFNTSRYHATAEDQLDAASYALKELIRDLSAVMTVPAVRSGAALYHLPAAPAVPAQPRRASAA
ncbi:MAG: hypothetical protein Q7T86_05690 [Hyphomicrobiaceae bacterium]|nr:hypothetical protein [Hyphomicrobiaceae bacterium]